MVARQSPAPPGKGWHNAVALWGRTKQAPEPSWSRGGLRRSQTNTIPPWVGGQRAAPGTEQNMSEIPTVPPVYLVLLIHSMEWRGWTESPNKSGMVWCGQYKTRDYGTLSLIKRNIKTCTACKYTKKSTRSSWLILMYLASALKGLSEQLWWMNGVYKVWIKDKFDHALSRQCVETRSVEDNGCELRDRTDRQRTDGQTCSSSIRLCNTSRLLLLNWWKPWEEMAWANVRTGWDQKKGGRRQTEGKMKVNGQNAETVIKKRHSMLKYHRHRTHLEVQNRDMARQNVNTVINLC